MERILLACFTMISFVMTTQAQEVQLLKISDDGHYVITENQDPFFWLGGTAWEMLHRLNEEETTLYLKDRAGKGFTVIQTVILAELSGLTIPNWNGDLPLINQDPAQINEKYFSHVDFAIRQAGNLGLYMGLLPTWGDKFNKKWGEGPEIFTPENAEIYGEILGRRYAGYSNIIWILGGDRIPETDQHYSIINAMARGIRKVDTSHLITYHPMGGGATAAELFNEEWLNVNMFQSGHDRNVKIYELVAKSRALTPVRPVINGEPLYENIPNRFWTEDPVSWLDDADVRRSAYRTMLTGAAGYTYGCNDIWQMYSAGQQAVIQARTDWSEAIHLPGSAHMKHMKDLLVSFPWQKMISDQSLIVSENPNDLDYMVCAVGSKRDFLLAYTPAGRAIELNLSSFKAQKVKAFWFNPRSGKTVKIGEYDVSEIPQFKPWAEGRGSDFVLVLMDVNADYKLPK